MAGKIKKKVQYSSGADKSKKPPAIDPNKPHKTFLLSMPGSSIPGRPRTLTQDIIDEVSHVLPRCYYVESLCQALAIDRCNLKDWVKRGRDEYCRLKDVDAQPNPTEDLYCRFYIAYKVAMARGEIWAVMQIRKQGRHQWQALAWLLERRFPERWSTFTKDIRELQRRWMDTQKELSELKGTNNGRLALSNGSVLR
jgi:hypothetical protein